MAWKVTFKNSTKSDITLRHDAKHARDLQRIILHPGQEHTIEHEVSQTSERFTLLDSAGETTAEFFSTDEVDAFERVNVVQLENNTIVFEKTPRGKRSSPLDRFKGLLRQEKGLPITMPSGSGSRSDT